SCLFSYASLGDCYLGFETEALPMGRNLYAHSLPIARDSVRGCRESPGERVSIRSVEASDARTQLSKSPARAHVRCRSPIGVQCRGISSSSPAEPDAHAPEEFSRIRGTLCRQL